MYMALHSTVKYHMYNSKYLESILMATVAFLRDKTHISNVFK